MKLTRLQILHIAKYLISGCASAVVNVGLLFVLVQIFHFYYLLGSVMSYVVAVIVSFVLQKFWTFGDKTTAKLHRQFGMFLLVSVPSLFINVMLMYVLVEWLGLWYLFAQIATGVLIAVTNYFGYRIFVFAKDSVK